MVHNHNCGHTMGWFIKTIKTIVFLQNNNNSNRQPGLT